VLTILGLYWSWESGRIGNLEASLSQSTSKLLQGLGLSLQNVYVEGRDQTSSHEILKVLGVKRGDYIFHIDLQESYERLKKLKWVASVMIERRLPSTIYIRLVEKRPIAFWQSKQKFYLVDIHGIVIEETTPQEFPGFIIATGEGAPHALPKLLKVLHKYTVLRQLVTAVVYVGQRRWDVVLKSGLRIKLPEDKLDESFQLLTTLAADRRLDNPDVKSIDVRDPARIYFSLKEGVLEKKKIKNQKKNT